MQWSELEESNLHSTNDGGEFCTEIFSNNFTGVITLLIVFLETNKLGIPPYHETSVSKGGYTHKVEPITRTSFKQTKTRDSLLVFEETVQSGDSSWENCF